MSLLPSFVGIIIARLDSSRLPGKALLKVNGLPLIGYAIARAKQISGLKALVLATSDRPVDQPLADYAAQQGIGVFRGDINDVVKRVLDCAQANQADYFIRLNGDSPFPDKELIEKAMHLCVTSGCDLVTNLLDRSFPYGISVEIIRTAAFAQAYAAMRDQSEHEHITQHFYANQGRFRIVPIEKNDMDLHGIRMVVDTEEDLVMLRRVAGEAGEAMLTLDFKQVAALYARLEPAVG